MHAKTQSLIEWPLTPSPLLPEERKEKREVGNWRGLGVIAGSETVSHPLVVRSLAAQAARGERLGVLVGHNRLDVYALTRLVLAHGYKPEPILARIELSRAFTCHQLHRRIVTLSRTDVRRWAALYVLGLLDTFYDEDVEYPEVTRLLHESLTALRRLVEGGLPVLITVSAPREPGRESLLEKVAQVADVYWEPDAPTPRLLAPEQLRLPLPYIQEE